MKVATNSALALIATYTFAHGILLWALVLPIPQPGPAIRAKLLAGWPAYLAVGVFAVATYFIGYSKPAVAPPSASISDWREVVAFMIVWLGAPLRSAWVSPVVTGTIMATVTGLTVALTFLLLARRKSNWRVYYPWLLFLSFSLLSGLLTAVGRVNLGVDAVFNIRFEGFSGIRYNATSVFAYVALIGLLYAVWTDRLRHKARLQTAAVIVLSSSCTLLAVAWTHLFAEERSRVASFQENRRRALAAITWIKVLPSNPEIFWAYPYPDDFWRHPVAMERLGIIKIPMVEGEIARQVSELPQATNFDNGSVDSARREDADRFRFTGWARNPENNRPADYVVLGWEDSAGVFHPFTVLLTGSLRLDVAQVFHAGSLIRCGFNQEIDLSKLPLAAETIMGWAVDFRSKKVFPLGGSIRLDRSSAK